MAPFRFRYPKSQHVRTVTPPPYRDYRRYKPFLRTEFSRTCVYCRLPDGMPRPSAFGVEHYEPVSKAPSKASDYNNLFYACNSCNSRKNNFWPTEAQRLAGIFLPNPCAHVMWKHLRYNGGRVEVGYETDAGHWTVELLQLNDTESLKYRELLLGCVERIEQELVKTRSRLNRIDEALKSCAETSRIQLLSSRRVEVLASIRDAESELAMLTGT